MNKKQKYLIIILLLIAVGINVNAYERKDLIHKKIDITKLSSLLVLNQKWVPYPSYIDRNGWDKLTGKCKKQIIQRGEDVLNYEWKVITATDYLAFDHNGSRKVMEDPFEENNSALSCLVLAELAEGKGRFVDKIADGVWYYCEMTSWALSAHTAREQTIKTSLPNYEQHIIDLTSSDMGSFLTWTYFFLKDKLDQVQPLISKRLHKNIQERILDPYMNRSDFWWQAFDSTPHTTVNNWNPWCNFNVLTCFMLLENNPEKLSAAVYRTMISVDKFIDKSNSDGACEEGPSYWGHAAGKMYDYLQILNLATAGKIRIFDEPMIKNMGEYISKSFIGNDWVVNFADASAKGGGLPGVIFRFGKAVNSNEMKQFAAYLFQLDTTKSYYNSDRDLFRCLENLASHNEMAKTVAALSNQNSMWYPQTEFCYMRNQNGFFFAAKGGYNNESHNHNDVGSFILYLNKTPMFIDAGVGTYNRKTFSNERYSIWNMQSSYHNLPVINGVSESDGAQFRSKNVKFNSKESSFKLDLENAYLKDAAVKKWSRCYQLVKNGLVINDVFELNEIKAPTKLNFLIVVQPIIIIPGVVTLEKDGVILKIQYNKDQFLAKIETIFLDDLRMSNIWGKQIFRLSLVARNQQLVGKYRISILK